MVENARPKHDDVDPTKEGARHLRRASTRRFVGHYLEMVAAMGVGMLVLGGASDMLLRLPDHASVTLIGMAACMTAPMIVWMRFRGHHWRACNEMAAAMLLPTVGALALLATGLVTDGETLLMVEHPVMLASMLAVMLLRRDTFACHDSHGLATSEPSRPARPEVAGG